MSSFWRDGRLARPSGGDARRSIEVGRWEPVGDFGLAAYESPQQAALRFAEFELAIVHGEIGIQAGVAQRNLIVAVFEIL